MKGTGLPQIGFIAQEVKPIIPEVVSGEDGSLGISYGNLVSLTVKAIQDLSTSLQALHAIFSLDSKGTIIAKHLTAEEAAIQNLKSQHATFGPREKPEGITVYDQHGRAGCLVAQDVETGSVKLMPGECVP